MIRKSPPTSFIDDLIEAKYAGATIMVFLVALAVLLLLLDEGNVRAFAAAVAYLAAVPVGTLIGRGIKR